MNKLKALLANSALNHWIVVDAIRVPDIEEQIYLHEPDSEAFKLYDESPFQEFRKQSPVIFQYFGAKGLSDQLFNDFAFRTSSVMFSASAEVSPYRILKHLQSLMVVNIDSKKTLLRFYSSKFWNSSLGKMDQSDIDTLLGPSRYVSWVNENKELVIYQGNEVSEPKSNNEILDLNSSYFLELI
ncbi:DUF4123 domain-containing protein [Vibrio nigripulchritudo]|uniref:DUF4123 domain-containing protein n=1 Tax=Vibrio nigripulchritudo TaxID=28173 RepID=UPI0024908AE9|nr:DUF4123 domain-containing protein [Vibrio nigripulchritudo]BDU38193.1 hypothetical protein TUMSATVNIG2_26620 [Vibrio nigripulchritudo]BDU43916.1 hypothetical protein TUMSATVNIG3_27140 [Vibrio nigripulchritudo]